MFFVCLLAIFFLNTRPILASEANIFGLHLTQTADIHSAQKIINSSAGDWGYATIVIRLDQLDKNTWQEFFDNCRKYHIIPIIRLASIMENNYWKIPESSDIDHLASFLNSLNWPSNPKYIIPFNEINHASEWGGQLDIKNFTDIFIYTATKFKSFNNDFFILSSPLDLAAPENPPEIRSAASVYQEIYNYQPQYFELIDGLASHSYPNHGFIGTPTDTGQHSIHGYQWELDYIKKLGVSKTYPVFITETGWPHREGQTKDNRFYSAETSATFLNKALDIWNRDIRIVAITPFIYNYSTEPFDHFSWLNPQEKLYPAYQQIIDLPKKQNHPSQTTKYQATKINLPLIIFSQKDQQGSLELKNIGQSIWGEKRFCLEPHASSNIKLTPLCLENNSLVPPGEIVKLNFQFSINSHLEKTYLGWNNTPQYEITSLSSTSTIYRPKTGLWQNIQSWLKLFLK